MRSTLWFMSACAALFSSQALGAPECRLDPRCPSAGRCTASGEDCVIASATDCLASNDCQFEARCSFDEGKKSCDFATGTGGHCKDTPACRQYGKCDFRQESFGRYCAVSDTSCEASFSCQMFGHCISQDGFSCGGESGDERCGRARACRLGGVCNGQTTRPCFPSAATCARSLVCKRAGRCTTEEFSAHVDTPPCQATAKGCAASEACRLFGRCTLDAAKNACVVTTCEQSEACTKYGACTLSPEGRCTARAANAAPPCALVEVTGLAASASSEQKTWKEYTFGAGNLVDRDLGTSWQPAKKQGEGARFEIRLPQKRQVALIEVANGFQRRDGLGDLQAQNGMIGHARVVVGAASDLVELQFEREPQRSYFGYTKIPVTPTETDVVSFEILSVSPGLLFDDLAVSEVRVYACAASEDPKAPPR